MGGSLTEEELSNILNIFPSYRQLIKTFIETGTYKGETARMAAKFFQTVHTIEIQPLLYQEAKVAGYSVGIQNIKYHLGDSTKILKELMKTPVPSVFFIDAHQSGPDTSNNGTWVPLMEELKIILESNRNSCIFIFDDVRLFDQHWDWKGITTKSILDQFGDRAKHNSLENDRFIVYT